MAIAALAACTGRVGQPVRRGQPRQPVARPGVVEEPEASVDPEDAALAFAQCMREHGIDMPDPQVGSNGEMSFSIGAGPGKLDRSQLQEAQEACQDLMPDRSRRAGRHPAGAARRDAGLRAVHA